ncbi:MerR family transcriptional regulator [Actinokineospora sp. NBRC 105648]|uniref:transcriptional regulator FtsR n=1 Tax=Actinokineospora sp. NBRC 105648 TaxID=3032206 RepID=UPI0024A1F20A|nr:MerR family transcriptional regulator [Actinokineospora sp. NBRC 105648]GLZ36777.1 MerR family transcriptional regulator [Actinokineospora sp. NBRC 105648]
MTAAGRPGRAGLSIGAVLTHLRPEFPDVTISKIRFLEAEGLVTPDRTPSGYRRFTEADVARLRFVLAAQRDHYLPLKVIKEELDRTGGPPPVLGAVARPVRDLVAVPAAAEDPPPPPVRLSRAGLLEDTGMSAEALLDLEQYGLVRAEDDGWFEPPTVSVARIAAALAEYGIEPRHLRAFRAAADREVALLEQVVAPMYRQRDPAGRSRADEIADDLAGLAAALHSLLVKAGLRRVTGK